MTATMAVEKYAAVVLLLLLPTRGHAAVCLSEMEMSYLDRAAAAACVRVRVYV